MQVARFVRLPLWSLLPVTVAQQRMEPDLTTLLFLGYTVDAQPLLMVHVIVSITGSIPCSGDVSGIPCFVCSLSLFFFCIMLPSSQ